MHECMRVCVYVRACMHECMCICVHVCSSYLTVIGVHEMHACVHVCMSACVRVCVYVCACMHECMCICMHVCSSYLTVIGVHEMHSRMLPNHSQITNLVVIDPLSSLAYPMMTHLLPIANKLPIKLWLLSNYQ